MNYRKKVEVFDINTLEKVLEFGSVKECALFFKMNSAYLSKHLHGGIKSIKRLYYCKIVEDKYYKPISKKSKSTHTPKPIEVYDKYGWYIDTYDTVEIAANATGVHPNSIYRHCRGAAKKPTKGYTFKYNTKLFELVKKTPVDLYDANTNLLFMSFDDIRECADFLGLTPQTIRQNLRGDIKTVKVKSFYCKYGKTNKREYEKLK